MNDHPKDAIIENVEQITSLQELNRTIHVITIKGWLALVFVALFCLAAILWAISGRLPVTVNGKCVALYEEDGVRLKILGFLPLFSGQQVEKGMAAKISLDAADSSIYGEIEGVVQDVIPFPVNAEDPAVLQIPSSSLRNYLTQGPLPTILVVIEPIYDPETPSRVKWTSKTGPLKPVLEGSVGNVDIILKTIKPISYVIPKI